MGQIRVQDSAELWLERPVIVSESTRARFTPSFRIETRVSCKRPLADE
jgi:hypothetical protein